MKKKLRDLLLNPRVEIIPSLLNLPLVGIIFAIIYIDPDFHPIINIEGAKIFGLDWDYVVILEKIAIAMACISIFDILITFTRRESVPIIFHIVPIITIITFTLFFSMLINNNDFLTISYIYQALKREISLLIYLAISILSIIISMFIFYGVPRLWNYHMIHETDEQSKKESDKPKRSMRFKIKFHPKTLSLITTLGFLTGLYYVYVILIGHPFSLFYPILLFRFDWSSSEQGQQGDQHGQQAGRHRH